MKLLWIDDMRQPPQLDGVEWFHALSVNDAKSLVELFLDCFPEEKILISLDHDAGNFYDDGGDYIKVLDWLEEKNLVDERFEFHLHSMNPVGVENMRAIIRKNNWREVLWFGEIKQE